MPTGYTAPVQDGKITTLREFALCCARGMGVCITMRDDPSDAPIPERFEPNTKYCDEEIKCNIDILEKALHAPDSECIAEIQTENTMIIHQNAEYGIRFYIQKKRYADMLDLVVGWQCSPEIQSLKDFMVEQLQMTIRVHGDSPHVVKLKNSNPDEWRVEKIKEARKEIEHHTRRRQEEIARTEDRNAWLKSLRDCLPEK